MAVDSEHAVAILTEICENGVKSDLITLVAGVGGRRIPIHRNILTANSKYFTASLGSNFVEADENEFILDDSDGPTLKTLVDFCYTGRIDLTEENVSKYLAIASGVELHLLEPKCLRFLADKLKVNNAVATLVVADKYSGYELRQKAFNFVCGIFDILPSTHIDELDHRLWKEILKCDDVCGEEQFIFERLLSWFRKDEDEREIYMTELLKLIRLPLIPMQYLDGDTIQITYERFDCLELLLAEKRRRAAYPTSNTGTGTRRRISIFCLCLLESAVKIERYICTLNEFVGVGEIELGPRNLFGAIKHENKVYILGGELDGVATKSVSIYDLSSDVKRDLPEMNSARACFATLLLGKFIYVFGGRNGQHRDGMNSCERFNLETETWEKISPMKNARHDASVAVLNGYIYIGCGYGDWRKVELFNPRENEWRKLPDTNNIHRALLIFNNHLYATGHLKPTERYDSRESRWTVFPSELRIYVQSSVAIDDKTYVIGNYGKFGEVKIDESGSSFFPLCESKLGAPKFREHQLCRNQSSNVYGFKNLKIWMDLWTKNPRNMDRNMEEKINGN